MIDAGSVVKVLRCGSFVSSFSHPHDSRSEDLLWMPCLIDVESAQSNSEKDETSLFFLILQTKQHKYQTIDVRVVI